MKTIYIITAYILMACSCFAQMYFPPKNSTAWATVSPESLGWQADKIPSVLDFLGEKNTKAFIVLKDGKIAIEQYYDDFTQDSFWYWASAGKTATAFLVGIAQEKGYLNIGDKTSQYLGEGWTNAPRAKEDLITIRHQLTMTTGLDDGLAPTATIPDPSNCLEPSCLQYLVDSGTRWAYHNAPYRLLQDVVANAAEQTWQQFTNQQLRAKIGMESGTWINYVLWSKPRDMARFGLLALNKGTWDGEVILGDMDYYNAMTTPSQDLNKSYGYLWWLNGQESFMLPQVRTVFPFKMLPSAPDDLFMALGKNDQKIYVYPSENIVVIRMGDSAEGRLALSSFDDELWAQLMEVFAKTTTNAEDILQTRQIEIFPNPGNDFIQIERNGLPIIGVEMYDIKGRLVKSWHQPVHKILVGDLPSGIYFLQIKTESGTKRLRWVKR